MSQIIGLSAVAPAGDGYSPSISDQPGGFEERRWRQFIRNCPEQTIKKDGVSVRSVNDFFLTFLKRENYVQKNDLFNCADCLI